MRLPRYTSTTVPRGSGQVRAQNIGALTASSDQALYSGLGAFGRGLGVASEYAFQATMHRKMIDVKNQTDDFEISLVDFSNKLMQSMADAPVKSDVERAEYDKSLLQEWDKYYQKKYDELAKAGGEKEALENIKRKAAKRRILFESDMFSFLTNRLHEHQSKTAFDNIEGKIRAGDIAGAKRDGDFYVNMGLKTRKQVDDFILYKTTDSEAKKILAEKGLTEAENYVMSQPNLDTDIKRDIVSRVNFEASQQQKAYQQKLQQKDAEYFLSLQKEELTQDAINKDLELGIITPALAKEYTNYIEAQQKERLSGEKDRDWDTYDSLQKMAQEYADGKREDESFIRESIGNAVKGRKITSTDGMKLIDRLKKSLDADSPLNKPEIKRGLGVLDDIEALEIKGAKDDVEIKGVRMKWLKKKNEYQNWAETNEDITAADVETQISSLIEATIQDMNWWDYLQRGGMLFSSPFAPIWLSGKARGVNTESRPIETPKAKKRLTPEIEDMSKLSDEELRAIIEGEK